MKQSKNTGFIQLNFYRENIKSQFSSLSLGKKGTLFMKERIGTLFMKESCLYWRVKRKQKCCK